MTIYQAVISGIVQGLTEFLPISSSGHLVILHHCFGLERPQVAFDVFLHLGTLLAIVLVFWREVIALFSQRRRLGLLIIAGSVPTAIIAILFGGVFERFFVSVRVVGAMLVVTGIWLALAQNKLHREPAAANRGLNFWQALIIGVSQGAALIPGISRSGATISTALLCGLERRQAVIFSFLLAIPATFGALLFKIRGLSLAGAEGPGGFAPFLIGAITAMAVGIGAIKFLIRMINKGKFYIFSVYCVIIGITVLTLSGFNNG